MSNPEENPSEVLCETHPGAGVQLLEPRDVPLGGPRAMNVRRTLVVNPTFEHGVLVDAGDVTVASVATPTDHLTYLAPGLTELVITATTDARLLLLGGEPLGESIIMWWNFIGRSHDEIVEYRTQWQQDVLEGGDPAGRFGTVADFDGHPLPAPELPTVRLKPRD